MDKEFIEHFKLAEKSQKQLILELISEKCPTEILKDNIKEYIKILLSSQQIELLNPFLQELQTLGVININNDEDLILSYCHGIISLCKKISNYESSII